MSHVEIVFRKESNVASIAWLETAMQNPEFAGNSNKRRKVNMGDADAALPDVDIVHDDRMSGLLESEPEEAAESSGQDKKTPWSWFDSAIHQLTQVLSNDDVGLMERSGAKPQHEQFHDNMVTLCQCLFAVGMSLCLTFCWTRLSKLMAKCTMALGLQR